MTRQTQDVLILILATTVCLVVILGMVGVVVAELRGHNPEPLPTYLAGATSTLIGMVAGYLAGRRGGGR